MAFRKRPESLGAIRSPAYSELERMGVFETQPGKGCFLNLKDSSSLLKKDVRRRMLIAEIDQVVVQAHHLQVPNRELLELVEERMTALEDKRAAYARKED